MVKTKNQIIKEIIIPEIIFHLGDIHIPGNPEREEEYETVLNRTIEIIKKETRNKMVVICGDLFHDKTKPYQEANILARKFMKNLGDVCDTIIIQGNHDVNIDNESRKDSIKATLCELETNNKIYYLTENEEYKINGINFILTKMTNEKVTPIKNKNIDELYIGLYHGTLYKSKNDYGYNFISEEKLKATDFKDYDIVMLGDIHKYQYMNNEKTIAYSGSLIQQNFGESIKNHGILLWDLKKKSSELIEIENKYIYKVHTIIDINDYKIPDIENKYCRLKLLYKKIERIDLIKYEKVIRQNYNILSITKQEIIEDTIVNESKIVEEDIINKSFMEVYQDFLKKKEIKEDKKITELLQNLLDSEKQKISKEKKELKLFELEFENLFTYGLKNKIKFNELHGINILSGTNGLGKSSIIDIILFTIYNDFSRGSGKDALNIRYNNGYSILRLELNGQKYTIIRKINKERTMVRLYQGYISIHEIELNLESEKKNKNISDDGKKNIDKQIINLFGTYDEMIMTSIILQVGINFIDLKDNDKKILLIKILGLYIYDNIHTICKNTEKNFTSNILKNLEKSITNINYKELIENDELELLNNEKKLKKINEEYMNMLKEKHIIEHNVENIDIDVEKINIQKKNFQEEVESLQINIQKLKKQIGNKLIKNIDNYKLEVEEKILNNQIQINNLSKEITKTKSNDIKTLEKEIEIINKIIENMDCEVNTIKIIIKKLKLKTTNVKILKDLSINDKKIENYKNKLEEEKENILNKINDKNILKNTIKLQRENNKDLLKHTFNEKCKCCLNNKLIHEQLGYLERIQQLEKEYNTISYNEKDIENIDEKIISINDYYDNDKKLEINILKQNTIDEKIKYEQTKINTTKEEILILKNNQKVKQQIKKLENDNNILNDKLLIVKDFENKIKKKEVIMLEISKLEDKIIKYDKDKKDIQKLKELVILEKSFIEKINEFNNKIKNTTNNITLRKLELEKQNKIINEYKIENEKKLLYSKILELYSNGFIDFVMEKRLNILEKKMNNILNILSNYEIKIKIEGCNIKFYKLSDVHNKKQKNKIINYEHELNVKHLCGYERIIFNLSIRLALNNMNIMTKNNFIVIDEGFSAADSINIHKFSLILEMIKKEYDICILISHIDEIKNQNGKIIKINYNNTSKDSCINI
jgi:DNA repair exonuclease SbcCD nuclease subunit/DNA repair exonuclease SbcCD ATPase subunit